MFTTGLIQETLNVNQFEKRYILNQLLNELLQKNNLNYVVYVHTYMYKIVFYLKGL